MPLPPDSLTDILDVPSAKITVRCDNSHCFRQKTVTPRALYDAFTAKGLSTKWSDLPKHLDCSQCRSRHPKLVFWIDVWER